MRLGVLALAFAACASNQALEGRVDELARHQAADAELARRVDAITAEIAALQASMTAADQKLAALVKTQQQALAAPRMTPPERRHGLDPAKTWSIAIDGDPVIGPPDAKVTLVEAMDYACPYCEKLRDTFADLKKHYGKDLRIVYKPFIVHPQVATTTAVAACAATRQGKFVEMDAQLWDKGFKDRSFEKDRKCWEAADGCPILTGFAKTAKLDLARFAADLAACESVVEAETRSLQALGVSAIPTSFVNGRALTGAMPAEEFVTLIDAELKLANDRIQAGTKPARYYQTWVVDKGQKTADPP